MMTGVRFLQRKSILKVSLCDEVERQLKAKTGSMAAAKG
jgi:hypothetical protein